MLWFNYELKWFAIHILLIYSLIDLIRWLILSARLTMISSVMAAFEDSSNLKNRKPTCLLLTASLSLYRVNVYVRMWQFHGSSDKSNFYDTSTTSVFYSSACTLSIPSDFAISSLLSISSDYPCAAIFSYDSLISKRSSCTMASAASYLIKESFNDYLRISSAFSCRDMASRKSLRELRWNSVSLSSSEIINEKLVINPVSLMKWFLSLSMFDVTLKAVGFCCAYPLPSSSSQSLLRSFLDSFIDWLVLHYVLESLWLNELFTTLFE